jgi:hypothetical protein
MVGGGVAVGKKGAGVIVAVRARVGLAGGICAGMWAIGLAVGVLFVSQPATTIVMIVAKMKEINCRNPNLCLLINP